MSMGVVEEVSEDKGLEAEALEMVEAKSGDKEVPQVTYEGKTNTEVPESTKGPTKSSGG